MILLLDKLRVWLAMQLSLLEESRQAFRTTFSKKMCKNCICKTYKR